MKTPFFTRFAVLSLLMGTATFPCIRPAFAQATSGITTTVGVVDEDKLADGYTAYKTAVDNLDKRAQALDQMIPAREFLGAEEGKRFDDLIVKDKPTPEDQKALQTVVDAGMSKRAAYMGLVSKVNRTDKEMAEMKSLQEVVSGNANAVRSVSEKLLSAIRTQQDATDKTFTERANGIVAQVAGEKKFSVVVRKKALVWSADSVDITSEVLSRLNR